MIDEELRMPNGTDKSFIDKLHTSNQTVKPYGKVLSNPNNFLVRRQYRTARQLQRLQRLHGGRGKPRAAHVHAVAVMPSRWHCNAMRCVAELHAARAHTARAHGTAARLSLYVFFSLASYFCCCGSSCMFLCV